MEADERALREWLGAESTRKLLRKIATRVEARLAADRLRLTGIAAAGGDRAGRVQEIEAELSLYLLEKARHFGSRLRARVEGIEQLVFFSFLNHLKDRARNSADDPYRYLYRRAREALSDAPGFFSDLRSGRYLMFSLEPQNSSGTPLSEEEASAIAPPAGEGTRMEFAAACRTKSLRHLAAGFWRQACAQRGGAARWIDLRDFCSWLAGYLVMPGEVPAAEEGCEREAAGTDPPAEHLLRPDEALRAEEIRRLARAFYERLSERERTVCLLRDALGLPWEEIARRMGYSGPAGPTHPHGCARRKLQSFLRDQARLSPEDFDPEDFLLFQDCLGELLKNGASAP